MIGSIYREYTTEFGNPVKERVQFDHDGRMDYWHHALGGHIDRSVIPSVWQVEQPAGQV